MRQVSAKKARDDRKRAKAKKVVWERAGGVCEAASPIAQVDPDARKCYGEPDFHEVKTRGRGGSAFDPENMILACRKHHDWIGANSDLADEIGLTEPSWA